MSARRVAEDGWIVGTLRRHEMPPEEIRAVLSADDPRVVHRYLELHRERLEERVEAQSRALASLERHLTEAILRRRGRPPQTRRR